MKRKVLLKQALLAAAFFAGLPANVYADSTIVNGMIVIDGNSSGTLSSDMTCNTFVVEETSTLTVNQGVTLTFSGCVMAFEGQSRVELHGTLTGSMDIHSYWGDNSYLNVYLSDGAKYTVTGLTCDDGDSYLVYYGYDAATDGNGTVSVKNGSTDVTSTSTGYKTTTYTFTATPASGYKFKNWTKGAGGEVLGTDASINVTCEQNGTYQVYANFEEDAVAVTGVTLSPTSASLTAGGAALELTPTVAPEGATDKTVKWSVTQTGDFVALYTDEACTQAVGTDAIAAAKVYVKPLAAGQATVTVTTNDGAKTANCAVTVAEPTYNVTFKAGTEDVSNWTATPSSAKKGETVTVKYTGTKKVKSVKAIKK